MASLTAIRTALAATVANVTGLRTSAIYTGQINPPMAVVVPQPGQDLTFATIDGAVDYNLLVALMVSYTEDASSQALLDSYIDAGSQVSVNTSVLAAIRANPTLGGLADFAVVNAVLGYGLRDWGGQQYLRADIMVQVAAHEP
jgi:hypothetical protein